MKLNLFLTECLVGVALFGFGTASGGRLLAAEPVEDYRFKIDVLATGMAQPLQVKLAPDGRIFFNELKGPLKIWKPSTQTVVEAAVVPTFAEQENGFLGFALDPKFAKNQWIYLYYSPTNYVGQRLSRFVMQGDALDFASEKIMLEFGEQRRECCHHAGSVAFGPDGNLFISSGDNTHPFGDSASYGPMDERPDHEPFDAQKGASNTQDLRGKILRIRPTAAGGYTIPEGNLFPPDGSVGRPEIFAMGCRNPWRMSVDQKTGIVYWGEVGPDAGGDGPRGSRGYDEINQGRHAGNFGWPYFVGNNFPYARYDYTTKELGPMFDPQSPVNNSPNNTGAQLLPPAQPAMIYWPYGKSAQFPELGEGGRTACAGPVFHYRPEFARTGGFPEQYDNCLLFYDWQRPFIKWARLDKQANFIRIEPFTAAVTVVNDKNKIMAALKAGAFVIRRPEDSVFGPDGCLYMIDYGETWGANPDSKLLRISYQRGNLAPIAVASATPNAGREPLAVSLSSAGSRDHEGDPLRYEWRLQPANKIISTEANPKITVAQPGNYVVDLFVSDGHGGVSKTSLQLFVGNTPPQVRFLSPQDGDFFTPGKPVNYQLLVEDAEDGSSADYEDLMEARTFVSARWSKGVEQEENMDPGLGMMRQNDCFNCHAVGQKIVGPPLLDIANKYRGQPGALDASVQRVLKGSSRVWSETPMLAHEQLTADQVQMMVRWIFSLEPGKTGMDQTRGLTGRISPPDDPQNRIGILEASYTDAGRAPVGALGAKATLTLRNRRVEAEDSRELIGAKVQSAGDASGKKFLRANADGNTARFTALKLADAGSVTCRVAAAQTGGTIEFHRDSAQGELLSRVEVKPTGDWKIWAELTAPIKSVSQSCDLVALFTNAGQTNFLSLDWIQFNPR
jgi:cytochrome c